MNISFKVALIVLGFLLVITNSFCQSSIRQSDTIQLITPPYQRFYSKLFYSSGIPIRSAEVVSDSALIVAGRKISKMLHQNKVIIENLISNGVELHIIGRNQQTSDLPEYADRKGISYKDNGILTDIDKRTRGMGGLYASCGEENLLNLPGDPYAGGYDICTHEFAHTIMDFGIDSLLRNKIVVQYRLAISKGIWHGVYASTNAQEYWAELSSWYFGAHGDMLPGKIPASGPNALKAYDPEGFKLLDSVYTGKLQSTRIVKKSRVISANIISGKSIEQAKLVVTNNSTRKLNIYWINQNGAKIFSGEVLPSSAIEKDTFYTNVWLIEGGSTPVFIQVYDPVCSIVLSKDY